MTARTRHPRRGFTLFELMVVMMLLLILAAVVLPSIGAFQGDTRQRAASDSVRAELAHARARARDESKPYRVAISEDGKKLRREADSTEFGSATADPTSSSTAAAVEIVFEKATAEVKAPDGSAAPTENGWVTVAVVLPDGTCRDDNMYVVLKDEDTTKAALYVHVRGLTGASRVVPNPFGGATK